MNITTETLSLTCGDSMLDGMDAPRVSEMMPDGMMGGDGMLSMMQSTMAGMTQMMQGGMMDGGMMGGGMGIWMLIGWLVPILVLVGLGVLIVWAIRKLAGDSGTARSGASRTRSGDDALEVARQRYARGEIDREEFRRIRSDLTSD